MEMKHPCELTLNTKAAASSKASICGEDPGRMQNLGSAARSHAATQLGVVPISEEKQPLCLPRPMPISCHKLVRLSAR